MFDTMSRILQGLANVMDANFIAKILGPLVDRYSSQALNSAGLVINGAGATFPKIGATDFYAVAGGVPVKVPAGTAMPALTGITITAAWFNVVCFYVDSAAALTVVPGTQGATVGAVVFPQPPQKKALVGFLLITNASTFTGGTTALDAATTVYFNPVGALDPTVLM